MIQLLGLPFLAGLAVAIFSGVWLVPLLGKLKARQIISTDAPKSHLAKGGTPTMGGAIVLTGVVVATALMQRFGPQLIAVLIATLAFGAIGFLDDLLIVKRGKNLGLRAREKLALQFAVSVVFAGVMLLYTDSGGENAARLPQLTFPRVLLFLYHVVLLVGLSNAVNLTDGLDGLAAGVSLPVWVVLAMIGGFSTVRGGASDWALIGFCATFAGATLGYLWYNAHPAQVFMGDTGSLAIGGAMGAAAIALGLEWIVLVAAAVHIVEAGSVTAQVISFKTTGKRIFKMSPLHHHFELCDWPETRIVARFCIVSAACSVLALVLYFKLVG